jgi:isopenicillin N synthase-like dioxygenase
LNDIPVIDVSVTSDSTERAAVAEQIGQACTEVGFFQLVNHGVDASAIQAVYDSMDTFRATDGTGLDPRNSYRTEQTLSGASSPSTLQLNYVAASMTTRTVEADAAGVDAAAQEYFHAGPRLHGCFPDRMSVEYLDFFHSTGSVKQLPPERPAWLTYFEQSRDLGRRILSLFASALDLPPDHFAESFAEDASNFTVNEYPARGSARAGGPQIIGRTHTDSGTLTLLHQSGDYEGLEVELVDGRWIRVPVHPDRLIINIGDLMARWTNGRWRSTPHRVIDAADATASRKSLVTFYSPALDTVVAPLPTCIGAGGAQFPPISVLDYERRFLAKKADTDDLVNRVDA